ncbi:hypothetical protein C499_00605 [Halogeometricum borinquense DSM 11551]|uniref:Uncharacterized protein n=1 Tax=Halogeometricum borinquense (strain ATCC 700274 / DSM 11551 / JCM 10706 / KCTC 4070 / PR3) TaxID=469382 RepID=E4NVX8_HALBP|nr:hypothetical protein [Halogeometricum borinquense]ADQ69198.1 hypothetical protein Hbor_38840 [Halogeometricum borinquense DSM 11551]ELY31613.1 hypothetical protein C499_00605 [Halogeometricum borinquense DSM 11551]
MSQSTTDPTDGYAVDRYREECHLDNEGYLHTGTASAHVNRIIIKTEEQRR